MNVRGGNWKLACLKLQSLNNLDEHLQNFPAQSRDLLTDISSHYPFVLSIKKERQSKLGDFRYPLKNETPRISLNRDENSYRVLITYLHELAHLIVFLDEGRSRNPHGPKWKKRFAQLLHIFNEQDIFPAPLKEAVSKHILKPKASSHADVNLLKALRVFDGESAHILLDDLLEKQLFRLKNGKVFEKGLKRRTRVLCREISTNRKYLIHSQAEVIPVE